MSDPLSRIPDSNAATVSKASDTPESPRQDISPPEDFLKLVVSDAADYRSVDANSASLKLGSPLDRLARERVFDSIVRKTLENPNHPYYSLVAAETRKEMIQRITALLNSSHYLIPSKRQA